MLLSEVIKGLTEGSGDRHGYGVAVLCRKRMGVPTEWGEIETFAVLDVAIDEADRTIDLLTNEVSLLTAEGLLQKLRMLEGRCADWSVYSKSSRISMDAEWDVQIDIPLVGTATNHEERVIGLLQGPDDQWRCAV
jgi:hypothetical protein